MADNPLGTQGTPAIGNQDIPAIGNQDIPPIVTQGIRAIGTQRIPAIGNANARQQNPASSHLAAPVTNAFDRESFRAFFMNRLEQLRRTAYHNIWRGVPSTVNIQILLQMKLIDADSNFTIPVQIALSFFPPLVNHTYKTNVTVTSILGQRTLGYEFNVKNSSYELTSGWYLFREIHSLEIGDYVIFSVDRSGNLYVDSMKMLLA